MAMGSTAGGGGASLGASANVIAATRHTALPASTSFTGTRHRAAGAGSVKLFIAVTRTADDFLVEIGRKPDDDALKAVFADWLLERGDPRGELMALQLKPHRTDEDLSREALLLKANVRSWLPDEVLINLVPSSIVFEKGVFAAARVSVRSQSALTASLSHPAWATVRRLAGAPLELIERCPVIEELTDLDEVTLTGLAQKPKPTGRLKTLGVIAGSVAVVAQAFWSKALDPVTEVRLGFVPSSATADEQRYFAHDYDPLRLKPVFLSRVLAHTRRLVLHTGWMDLVPWFLEMENVDPAVPEVQLTPMSFDPSTWWIRFTDFRKRVTISPGSELNASFSEAPVREILATAPEGWFLELTMPPNLGWESVRRLPCFRRAKVGVWSEG